MNYQITLEELGIIPKQEPQKAVKHINYAFPCGECRRYDRKGTDNWRAECRDYKTTDAYAKALRKRFKALKPESEG